VKNISAALLAVFAFGFQSHAFATDACVPTMTVEQAQSQMDAGIAKISQEINQSYAEADSVFNQETAKALKAHIERLTEIEARYQEEVRIIKANLNLGWREKLAAATEAHNQAGVQSANRYTSETEAHLVSYNQTVAQAQAAYNAKAAELAANYNNAVCAGK